MNPVKAGCTCGGRLVKAGPHAYQCRACRQLWRDDHLPPFLTMVTPETDLPPWFREGRVSDTEPLGWDIYITYGGDLGHPVPVDPDRDYAGFVPNDGTGRVTAADLDAAVARRNLPEDQRPRRPVRG